MGMYNKMNILRDELVKQVAYHGIEDREPCLRSRPEMP